MSLKFQVKIEKDEDGWFVATCPSLPGCISQGKTETQALKNIKEAISLHLETLAEDGVPLKQSEQRKTVLVAV